MVINANVDWERLTLDGQRGLVSAVVSEAVVMPNLERWAPSKQARRIRITIER